MKLILVSVVLMNALLFMGCSSDNSDDEAASTGNNFTLTGSDS